MNNPARPTFGANLGRRDFIRLAGLATALGLVPRPIRAALAPPRVVVVGGGFGGATVAKYLRLWGGDIAVTLVDDSPVHYSCILSNLVVNGKIPFDQIIIGYDSLEKVRGVKRVLGRAESVDPAARRVTVLSGSTRTTLDYDHLVLAPGVDFIKPPGAFDAGITPHAWKAGPQTELLKKQLKAYTGGAIVMTIPKAPYRCPPGPYERACMFADTIKRRKLKGKVVVLDANPGITAEPETFGGAFAGIYKDIVDYRPSTVITSVDSKSKSVVTAAGTVKAALLNVIPDMKAGGIVAAAGLVNDPTARWAAVDPLTYGSTARPEIHVIGDSQATGQPKSGHMANSQAKVCADAIIRALNGQAPDPDPVTASACFSPITWSTASWLTVNFRYDPATKAMVRANDSFGEAGKATSDSFEQMFQWAHNIFADSFA